MKKLVLFTMTVACLSIFNACEKNDELITQRVDVHPKAVVKPDVYSENGYLAFKDLNVLDSVMNALMTMSGNEIAEWEKSYDFQSANTHFQPIFDESEKLISKEEWDKFRAKNLDILRWSSNPEDYSFDYPFVHTNLVPVLNKDGLVKIGQSLFKYNKENKVVILDGDYSKLEDALSQNSNTDNIRVFGKENMLKSSTTDLIHKFLEDYGTARDGDYIRWSSSRRMLNYLNCERFTYTTYSGSWEGGYRIYLYQKAQKKAVFWVNYYTQYRMQDILYKENGVTKVNDSNVYTTGEVKPSTTFSVYQAITVTSPYEPALSSISRANPIYFKCGSTCRGFDYYPIQIDYQD